MKQLAYPEDLVSDVKTVEEFLARYYRPERYTGRTKSSGWWDDYAPNLLARYQRDFEQNGSVGISRHDSVTGRPVTFVNQAAST